MAKKSFRELVLDNEQDIFDILHEIMTAQDPSTGKYLYSARERLEAAGRMLDKAVPNMKTLEVKGTSPVTFIFNSPQVAAARVLGEESERRETRALAPQYVDVDSIPIMDAPPDAD